MAIMTKTHDSGLKLGSTITSGPTCRFSAKTTVVGPDGKAKHLGQSCQFMNEFPNGEGLTQIASFWFCTYHLPFNANDFAAIARVHTSLSNTDRAKFKSTWDDTTKEEFTKSVFEKIRQAQQSRALCDLSGVVFPSGFEAQAGEFPFVSFAHARFSGGHASFDGVRFVQGSASFEDAEFSGGDASFEDAQFCDEQAIFAGVRFSGANISFARAQFFGGAIRFDGACFSGRNTCFNDAQFSGGDTSFANVQFSGGEVRFDNANFPGGNATFEHTQFSKPVSFRETQFSGGNASFEGARLLGGADFDQAEFSGGDADFSNAEFSGSFVTFSQTRFTGGQVWFQNAQFRGAAVIFHGAQFAGGASFSAPRHDTRPPQGTAAGDFDFGALEFRNVQFEEWVTFENRRFTRNADFTDAHFAAAPSFHGCTLHQDTTFPPIENFHGRQGADAARAYRTLKLAMGEQRATAEEAMFWALEQIAARSTLDPLHRRRDVLPWLLSWAYEVTSFYGLSVSRPLLLFLVSTLIAFPIYVYQPMHEFAVSGRSSDGITLREISDAETFSMRQVTRPFAIWGRFDLDALQLIYPGVKAQPEARQAGKTNPEPEPTYFWTKMTATAQSALSLALVALFLLAVRRRFRMV